jgi:hypothetical protein
LECVSKKQDADALRISVEVATAVCGIQRSVRAIDTNSCLAPGELPFNTLTVSTLTVSALKAQRAFVDGAFLLDDVICKVLVVAVLALAALLPESAEHLLEVVRATSLSIEKTKKAPDSMRGGLEELVQMFQKQYDAGDLAKACLHTEGKVLCIAMTDTIKCYTQGAADMQVSLKGYLKALQDKLHIVRQLVVYTKDTRSDVNLAEHVFSVCNHSALVVKWNSKDCAAKDFTLKDVVALSDTELGELMTGWKEVLKFGKDAARTLLAEACNDAELVDKFFGIVQTNSDKAFSFPTTLHL